LVLEHERHNRGDDSRLSAPRSQSSTRHDDLRASFNPTDETGAGGWTAISIECETPNRAPDLRRSILQRAMGTTAGRQKRGAATRGRGLTFPAVGSRRQLREERLQIADVNWLDQVTVAPGVPRLNAVSYLTPAGECDDGDRPPPRLFTDAARGL